MPAVLSGNMRAVRPNPVYPAATDRPRRRHAEGEKFDAISSYFLLARVFGLARGISRVILIAFAQSGRQTTGHIAL